MSAVFKKGQGIKELSSKVFWLSLSLFKLANYVIIHSFTASFFNQFILVCVRPSYPSFLPFVIPFFPLSRVLHQIVCSLFLPESYE